MATEPPFLFTRLTPISGPSTRVQWRGDFHAQDGCAGGPLTTGAPGLATVEANAPGPPQTFNVPGGARSWNFSVASYPGNAAGTVNVKLEGSNLASFAGAQLLFQGPINYPPPFTFVGPCVSTIFQAANPCQYGTQLTIPGTLAYFLTPAIISGWLDRFGAQPLAWLFSGLWYTFLNAETLCQQGPPPIPTIDLSLPDRGVATVQQLLNYIAWPSLCECKPGTPAPVPFPTPPIAIPVGWPSFPTQVITIPGDPAALTQLINQIQTLQKTVSAQLDLITASQRFKSPFAYISGGARAGLTGEGEFGVSRIVGIHIDVTAQPPTAVHLLGNPDYVKDLGWISINTPLGMLKELRVAQEHRDWFT